jgi:hypothetical protein
MHEQLDVSCCRDHRDLGDHELSSCTAQAWKKTMYLQSVGQNVLHVALLLDTTSTIAIARYFIALCKESIVNTPYQERSPYLIPLICTKVKQPFTSPS